MFYLNNKNVSKNNVTGWKCNECQQINTNHLVYKCENCGHIDGTRKDILEQILPIILDENPGLGDLLGALFVGFLIGAGSISESVKKQQTINLNLKKELNKLKKIAMIKSRKLEVKETELQTLRSAISNMEEELEKSRTEVIKLEASANTQEKMFDKLADKGLIINLKTSAKASQNQSQIQSQVQSIDFSLYQKIILSANEVENEIQNIPEKYKALSDELKKELKDLLKDIKSTNKEDFIPKLKERIMQSRIYKFISKPENITKVSKTLIKFLDLIKRIPF